LGDGFVDAEVETSVGNGRLFAFLAEHAEVTDRRYDDSRVTLQCRVPRKLLHKVHGEDTTVRVNGHAAVESAAVTSE
jgi:GTP-binding protein HflX